MKGTRLIPCLGLLEKAFGHLRGGEVLLEEASRNRITSKSLKGTGLSPRLVLLKEAPKPLHSDEGEFLPKKTSSHPYGGQLTLKRTPRHAQTRGEVLLEKPPSHPRGNGSEVLLEKTLT